ncbi:MAG: transposase [Muribaculaceae bacterium]|nr:transposase [Muribaculaceae bacterium]
MVTVSAAAGAPRFSEIMGTASEEGVSAWARLLPAGALIEREIVRLPEHYPVAKILAYSVMPDHLHIVVFIRERTETSLPRIVAAFKAKCTQAFRMSFPESPLSMAGESLFAKGFNDRIVRGRGEADAFCRYVEDNPKRYYIRKNHPEYFDRCRIIAVNGRELAAYGNLLLLRHCVKSAVKVSRSLTPEETICRERAWSETIRSRGVLVSPFISPGEKEVFRRAAEGGAGIIHILPNGFPERFKPSGREFDLCAEGRLLLIAPVEHDTRKTVVSRERCLEMNELAALVAANGLSLAIRREPRPGSWRAAR